MNSILNSTAKDLTLLVIPGLLVIPILIFFPIASPAHQLLAIFAIYFADAGHVYSTYCRYQHKIASSKWELLAPMLFFFLFFFIWLFFELPHLWAFVIYLTYAHNLRQIFGISRWYQKVNSKFDSSYGTFLFYALNILPFVLLHFRSNIQTNEYPTSDLLISPNPELLRWGLYLYGVIWLLWLYNQFRCGHMGRRFFSVFLYPFSLALIYLYCFLVATTVYQLMIPLMVSHGVAYMALIQKSRVVLARKSSWLPIILLGLLGGFISFSEDYLSEEILAPGVLRYIVVAIPLTMLFTHFFVDPLIWRSSNPDAHQIYNSKG